jgi:hypothetical protein
MYDKHQALMKCGVLSHDIFQSQLHHVTVTDFKACHVTITD